MSEAELVAEVERLCDELGLLYHHCTSSTRCRGRRGFPDLVIAGISGVAFAELKSDDGETTAEQDLWLYTLARGASLMTSAYIWRPADLEAGRIRRALERLK